VLCGASRPGHFEGVTTVVSKLFNIVQPDEAVFGIKDYQQLAVIRRMAQDLCMPVKISSAPIYREPDGLAMSSRNSFITLQERPNVTVLKTSLEWIVAEVTAGNLDFTQLEIEASKRIVKAGFRTDYVTISNSKTLKPAAIDDSQITVLGAMFTKAARLIDNVSIELLDGKWTEK
jgi:pantoate--beta-alanine ligase